MSSGVFEGWGDPNQKVAGPLGHSPLRRPNSVRRTMALEATWPDGETGLAHIDGRARDVFTPDFADDSPLPAPLVLAEANIHTVIGRHRDIAEITSSPTPEAIKELIGCRGGGHLRVAISDRLPEERALGTPLYLLLDDLAGTTLVAPFAWSRWNPEWMKSAGTPDENRESVTVSVGRMSDEEMAARRARMENICIGFATGSSSLTEDRGSSHRVQPVVSLVNPEDPDGWHKLPDLPPQSFRRARRIDVSMPCFRTLPAIQKLAVLRFMNTHTSPLQVARAACSLRSARTHASCRSANAQAHPTTFNGSLARRSLICARPCSTNSHERMVART